MLAVPISENFRRKNPLLPKLLYVDATETIPKRAPNATKRYLSFTAAVFQAQQSGNRLAMAPPNTRQLKLLHATTKSSILQPDSRPKLSTCLTTSPNGPLRNSNLSPLVVQFVTPAQDSRVLAGYGDPDKLPGLMRTEDNKLIASTKLYSASIGFRGVRSGGPRFVKP